jgi:hypothetical protein
MAGMSSLTSFSPAQQARFKQQREFVKTYQKGVPGLVQRVSAQCGCTVANVYSVLNGSTFNAEVIKSAYALVSAHLGHVNIEGAQGEPLGLEGLRRLAEARIAESEFKDAVTQFQASVDILKAQRRVYLLSLSGIETWLTVYREELPDQVATEIAEYLQTEASDPQMQVTPLSNSIVTRILGSEAAVDKASMDAVQRMIENGEIGPDGYPLPPALRTLQAWEDPDPEAPGQHYDEHGEKTYYLSLRDSNKWQAPEEEEVVVEEADEEVLASLKASMLDG